MKNRYFPISQNENIFFRDGSLIGEYWYDIKEEFKCNRYPFYKLLEDPILKKDYDNYCDKYWIVTSKIKQLKDTMSFRKDPITQTSVLAFMDGSSMGEFWHQCKMFLLCNERPYSLLLENSVLKEDYINYTNNNSKSMTDSKNIHSSHNKHTKDHTKDHTKNNKKVHTKDHTKNNKKVHKKVHKKDNKSCDKKTMVTNRFIENETNSCLFHCYQ